MGATSYVLKICKICRWIESVIKSEAKSEREKQISYINAYVWSLEKWSRADEAIPIMLSDDFSTEILQASRK